MSLDGSRMGNTMYAYGQARRFRGPRFHDYCQIVGLGSVFHIVGKSFTTTDVGLVPGIGAGVGVSLVSIIFSTVSDTVYSTAQGFGFRGPKLRDKCDIFAQSLIDECMNADLVSTHTPVYQGVGTLVPGSIPVVMSAWKEEIRSRGEALRFRGPKWPQWCEALATGGVAGIQLATGTVAITGTFIGVYPPGGPGPVPGAGTSVTGVIS